MALSGIESAPPTSSGCGLACATRSRRASVPALPTRRTSSAVRILKRIGSRPFVLERHLHLGPIALDLAVLELHVELADLGDAQVAQGLGRSLDRRGRGFLPGLTAGANQLDHLIDALGHADLRDRGMVAWDAQHAASMPGPQPRRAPWLRGRCP